MTTVLGDLSDAARLKAYDRYEAGRRTTDEAYIRFGCGVSQLNVPHPLVKSSKKASIRTKLHIFRIFPNLIPIISFTSFIISDSDPECIPSSL
jgi:hypothetical protein